MSEQARTGDLSLRLPEEPFTEIGQISHLYNKVMDTLEESSIEKESFGALMKTIPYGMFMLDNDWNIAPQYSAATPRVLGCPNPENYNFLLLMARILSRDKTVALKEFLERLYNPEFKQSALESVNPIKMLEVTMRKTSASDGFETTEKKTIRFEFSRIYNSQHTKILHAVVYANPVNAL